MLLVLPLLRLLRLSGKLLIGLLQGTFPFRPLRIVIRGLATLAIKFGFLLFDPKLSLLELSPFLL
ncbi:MAG: hypothetical protein G8D58_09120 [gamma proteobacterium symbiont of Phacoides pectinatus]